MGGRKLAIAAALLFAFGIVVIAGPAGAAVCQDCDPGGGGDTNSAPTVSVDVASMTVNEGQRVTNTGTYSDIEAGDIEIEVWVSSPGVPPERCGTVTKTGTNSGTWSWSSTPNEGAINSLDPLRCNDDGPLPLSVTVVARDSGGAEGQAGFTMTVDNVAPRATLNDYGQYSWREGDPRRFYQAYSLSNPLDPSHADRAADFQVAYDCGDGYDDWRAAEWQPYWGTGNSLWGYNEAGRACESQDSGTREVSARIKDKDGGVSQRTETVTIENVAPTATFNAPDSVDEGTNFAVSLTDPQDPSSVDRQSLRYAFDCGSGYGASGSANTASCTDAGGSRTVKGKIIDKDGGETEYTHEVTVNNIAPTGTIEINGGAAYTKSATVSLTLSASDPAPGSGVDSMRFSNDGTNWSAWKSYATSKSWTLSGGNGTRTVHVQYRDKAGNISTAARDAIKVDTAKPTISGMSPKHASITRDTTPTIKATVRDNMTNLAKGNIKLYVNGSLIPATKYSYSRATDQLVYNSPKLSKGKKTVRIVATDAAKNVGARSWYFTIR